jgi:ubiquinone/menaquinone biosynthesis C-methylase UbiE
VVAPTYDRIFDVRAHRYHAAMRRAPHARREEIHLVRDRARLRRGARLLDVPCGGGYLATCLPPGLSILGVDPSASFAALGRLHASHAVVHAPLEALPVGEGAFDVAVSLAGLHHVADLGAVFAELARVVVRGGSVVVADVDGATAPATFLDGFVDAHNVQGHRGDYFGPHTAGALRRAGFRVVEDRLVPLRWHYASRRAGAAFLADLFGVDAPLGLIEAAVARTLGWREGSGGVFHDWALRVLVGQR